MIVVAALGLGLVMGVVLGALGGGGAILTVPALVFAVGQSAQDATTSSLVIVGLTSAFGAASHARAGQVRWRTGIAFGVAGIGAAFAGTALNRRVDEDVLLAGLAVVMAVAAVAMLRRAHTDEPIVARPRVDARPVDAPHSPSAPRPGRAGAVGAAALVREPAPPPARSTRSVQGRWAKVLAAGLGVGFLTGFFGVGGGFVIVPALVLALGLPMPAAVGTSLLVIAVNSAASLVARVGEARFDWVVIVPFTLTAMAGTLAGRRIADRLPVATLTTAFAVLLLAVAAFVASQSLPGLV